MKTFVFFFFSTLLALAWSLSFTSPPIEYSYSVTFPVEGDNDHVFENLLMEKLASGGSPRIMEQQIRNIIDGLIGNISEFTPYAELDVDVLNGLLVFQANITNATIEGIQNYTITDVQLGVLPLLFKLGLHFDGASVSCDNYYMNGLLATLIPVYGRGNGSAGFSELDVYVEVHLSSVGTHLVIQSIDFKFSLASVSLNLKNFMGGDLGALVQSLANDYLPEYINRILCYYGKDLIQAVQNVVQEGLNYCSMNQILDWLGGKGDFPCVPPKNETYFEIN